jgi:hypothetical protein
LSIQAGHKSQKMLIMGVMLKKGKLIELRIKNTPRCLIKCEVLYLKSYNEKKTRRNACQKEII